MSLPFVIVLYALIRDDTGVGGGGQRQSNLGTCLRLIFHVCMFLCPRVAVGMGMGEGELMKHLMHSWAGLGAISYRHP